MPLTYRNDTNGRTSRAVAQSPKNVLRLRAFGTTKFSLERSEVRGLKGMSPNGFLFTFTMLKFPLMLKTDYIWKAGRSNKTGPAPPHSTNWLGSTVAMTYGGTEAPGHFRDQSLPDSRCKFAALDRDAWWPQSQVSPVKSPKAICHKGTPNSRAWVVIGWQSSLGTLLSSAPSPWVHVHCRRHCIN